MREVEGCICGGGWYACRGPEPLHHAHTRQGLEGRRTAKKGGRWAAGTCCAHAVMAPAIADARQGSCVVVPVGVVTVMRLLSLGSRLHSMR